MNAKSVANPSSLKTNSLQIIDHIFRLFKNKPIMNYYVQSFDQYPLINAHLDEKQPFLKTLQLIHTSRIPPDPNIISSHVVYSIDNEDDNSLKVKS